MLDKNIETDILVVGGGICGVLCAYQLSQKGYSVVLVEKDELGSHRTIKTTAVITALQDVYYSQLIKLIGRKKTKLFLKANIEAIEEYKKLSDIYAFDYEEVNSYKYSDNKKKLDEEVQTLSEIGYLANRVNLSYNKLKIYAIEFKNQGQMNPMKLISELTNHFQVYEHSMVTKIKNNNAVVGNYKIKANKIILATGYPFFRWHGGFFMKLIQNKSYVVAFKTKQKSKDNGIGEGNESLYFRSYQDYLFVGGNDRAVGEKGIEFQNLDEYVKKYHPNCSIEKRWINQDCVSLDGIPYIGKLRCLKNVYVATGFNLWGMCASMIASNVLTDLICNKKTPYQKVFSIYRRMPIIPLIKNLKKAVVGLIGHKKIRCTHMGCALKWNDEEKKYECTCHGSTFDEEGNPIENPARGKLKKKNHKFDSNS